MKNQKSDRKMLFPLMKLSVRPKNSLLIGDVIASRYLYLVVALKSRIVFISALKNSCNHLNNMNDIVC